VVAATEYVAGRAHRHLGGAALQVINRLCGVVAAFGAYAVIAATT
jgi:hypothetical protein